MAAKKEFRRASWQMRNVNFKRAILKGIKQKDRLDVAKKPKGAGGDQA